MVPCSRRQYISWVSAALTSILSCGLQGCPPSAQNTDAAANDAANDVTADAIGNDGQGSDGGACTQFLPASGFTNIAMGDTVGYETAFVVDEHGSPIVAWAQANGTSGQVDVYIRRWDSCTGAWGTPLRVDGGFGQSTGTADTPSSHNIALGYDRSNGTIGVAYQAQFTSDGHYEIRYAQLMRGASAFGTAERVQVQGDPNVDPHRLFNPGLALSNGNAYLAYQVEFLFSNSDTTGISYRSRSSGGTWTDAQSVPDSLGNHSLFGVISMAVDSAGMPALAFWTTPDAAYTIYARYWRPGAAHAITVLTKDQTDDPGLSLTFDGTHPRLAAAFNDAAHPQSTVWYSGSDDGMTWTTPVALPNDHGAGIGSWVSISVIPTGGLAIASTKGSSDGTDTCGSPEISRTTDLSSFVTCGPAQSVFDQTTEYVGIAYGPDGKLQGAFRHPPGGGIASGVYYFREN